jgi:hypothetical protein
MLPTIVMDRVFGVFVPPKGPDMPQIRGNLICVPNSYRPKDRHNRNVCGIFPAEESTRPAKTEQPLKFDIASETRTRGQLKDDGFFCHG